MALLEKQLQDKIDELSNLSYDYYESGNKEKSYMLMEDAWNLYPEPKENWNESFNTARYALDDLLKDSKMEKALIWYERICKIHKNLGLWEGVFEFYSGKYFFENKDYKKSYEFFKKSVEIRKNLNYFEGENSKYLAFYQDTSKLLKTKRK